MLARKRRYVRADADHPTEFGQPAADPRAVTVVCSTEVVGRDDLILISGGIDLSAYRRNPVWLWEHRPEWPIARSQQIEVIGDKLIARVVFPRPGVSRRSDEIYGLIREKVINAASTGFDILEAELIDRANPKAGTRVIKSELVEMSFVSLPAVPDALVTERALRRTTRKHHTLEYHRLMARMYAMSAERYGRELAADKRRRR